MAMYGCRIWRRILSNKIENGINYSTAAAQPKITDTKKGHCLISSHRPKLNHYVSVSYNKLDEVPLVSKGWNHSKSKGDSFRIVPYPETLEEPSYKFEDYNIHPDIIEALRQDYIYKATELQASAIEHIRSNKHILLAAETGCGKTLAYLLPIIQSLIGRQTEELNSPKAVVLVPNRELAYQIGEVATRICEPVGVGVKIIVGGRTKKIMLNPVFDKVDLLVATPGVLGKLATVGIYKLNDVDHTVLDEADTLLDDSFVERISGLSKRLSQSQFILVSATLPRKLPDVLLPIQQNMHEIISPKIHRPLLHVNQKFLRLTKSAKPSQLLQLAKANNAPMLVFTNRNETCNWVALFLRENGVPCSNINGDMNHALRIDQWNQFVRKETKILSATDVASRGLNTIQVKHVLNYDFPFYAADYLHRVGRVGRLGSSEGCKITNFISGSREIQLVQQIELAIRTDQPLPNVDGNITNIVQRNILRQMKDIS